MLISDGDAVEKMSECLAWNHQIPTLSLFSIALQKLMFTGPSETAGYLAAREHLQLMGSSSKWSSCPTTKLPSLMITLYSAETLSASLNMVRVIIVRNNSLEKEQLRTRWSTICTPQAVPFFLMVLLGLWLVGNAAEGVRGKQNPPSVILPCKTCALYNANSLYSYFVPHSREIMEHSSDLAGTAAPSLVMLFPQDCLEAGKQRARLKGWVPSQLSISCSSSSTQKKRQFLIAHFSVDLCRRPYGLWW